MPVQLLSGESVSAQDLDLVRKLVLKLGGYAEGLFQFHDFGFDREILRNHISAVYEQLTALRGASDGPFIVLKPPGLPEGAVWDDAGESWNYLQTLRLAAGAIMISRKYQSCMRIENLWKSTTAKILHKCQIGILDDVIDRGDYNYLEAKELHHLVLSSMIDPRFDSNVFMRRLMSTLKQKDVELFEPMTRITKNFNQLYNSAPHGSDFFYQMEILDERIALGEALTMFQKENMLNLETMEKISTGFYAPYDDLAWHEKLGAHISPASRYNFIDMAFCDKLIDISRLSNFMSGWYYYDAAIILMDHVVNIYQDLRNGIANLSLISMREGELQGRETLRNYNPRLSLDDYERHLARIASLASRGIQLVTRDVEDTEMFYPFITLMMPVVVMADWIGSRDDMIHMYLRGIAPAIRKVAHKTQEPVSVQQAIQPAV